VYATFIISAVLAGKLDLPGFWARKGDYFRHEWVPSPRRWIDPLKEANANRIALQTGEKTFGQVAAENGGDWKDQIDQISEINAYAASKGVDIASMIAGAGARGAYDGLEPEDMEQMRGGG